MMKNKKWDISDRKYNNIESIETLEDGSASLLLKEGRRAIVQIVNLEERFEAAIYRMAHDKYNGVPVKEEKHVMAELGKHKEYNDCVREALGWVEENKEQFPVPEAWEPGKK